MKKIISTVLFIISALLFVAMFSVDGSGAILDMTNSFIWICCILAVVFLSLGFYILHFRYKVFIWALLVIIAIMATEPAKNFHKSNAIEIPGTELNSPPKLYIMTDDRELTVPIGDYKWYCHDNYKENHWGFTEWVRIGFPEYAEYKLSSDIEYVTLRFTDFPDEVEIRYWESVNWDWPSKTGKKIELNEENSFEMVAGYYRIDGQWNDYGNAEYCFVVK